MTLNNSPASKLSLLTSWRKIISKISWQKMIMFYSEVSMCYRDVITIFTHILWCLVFLLLIFRLISRQLIFPVQHEIIIFRDFVAIRNYFFWVGLNNYELSWLFDGHSNWLRAVRACDKNGSRLSQSHCHTTSQILRRTLLKTFWNSLGPWECVSEELPKIEINKLNLKLFSQGTVQYYV